jgi:predicted transcriptional regulator
MHRRGGILANEETKGKAMPKFIKMGLGGTGYLGKKELHRRKTRLMAKRRKVADGYPIQIPFATIKDVRNYLSGDKIICLLCGQSYRRIGTHLISLHQMTPDEYREKYKIPYGYGLICTDSKILYSDNAKMNHLHEKPDSSFREERRKEAMAHVRKCPFKKEIAVDNISKAPKGVGYPRRPLILNPATGKMETFTRNRERTAVKKGTPEFHDRMKARPQVKASIERLENYWTGKTQSQEHVQKRIEKMVTTKLQKKSERGG